MLTTPETVTQTQAPNNTMATIQLKPTPALTISIQTAGSDPREIFKASSFWTREFPKQCGHCKSKNIVPSHRKAQSHDFYEAICCDCNYTFAFGQLKDGSGIFPKNQEGWKPPYAQSQGGGSRDDGFPDDTNQSVADDDDIPF